MSKLIIHNNSDASDIEALEMVKLVIGMGRVSKVRGDMEFPWTTFLLDGNRYAVYTDRNLRSDRFRVQKVRN